LGLYFGLFGREAFGREKNCWRENPKGKREKLLKGKELLKGKCWRG
jgi:hypothetical protein